jgi:ankyrin repeat/IBR domain-containing protein 1
VYQSSAELRRVLDPSHSYGDHHHHNTPLHYAARHGMKHLIRAFLNDLGGNPNRRNGRGQTALHCVCSVSQQKSLSGETFFQSFYKYGRNDLKKSCY